MSVGERVGRVVGALKRPRTGFEIALNDHCSLGCMLDSRLDWTTPDLKILILCFVEWRGAWLRRRVRVMLCRAELKPDCVRLCWIGPPL